MLDPPVDRSDGDHRPLQRTDLAAAQGLERDHDLGRDQHRIDPQVRIGAVRAHAAHRDIDAVRTGRGDVQRGLDLAGRGVGRDVEGQGVVRLGEAAIEAVLHHGPGAEDPLLRRLADQDQGAGPVGLARRHLAGGADQGGDVHIMAAGVHDRLFDPVGVQLARRRGVGQARAFLQRQTIHVGADHDGGPVAVLQHRDHARAADAGRDLISQGRQLARQPRRGLDLLPRQFGIAVEPVEQGREIGVIIRLHRRLQAGVLRQDGRPGRQGQSQSGRRQYRAFHP